MDPSHLSEMARTGDTLKNLKKLYQTRFGIKQPLRPYQLKAVNQGINQENIALLMAPRLGKTRIAISIMGYRHLKGQVFNVVIICPSIAKDVWKTELQDTLAVPHDVTVVEGKAEERKALIRGFRSGLLNILIINPEAIIRLKKLIYKTNPEMVIVDEAHKFKNRAAKQSRVLHTLGKRASYRCIMTGTFLSTPTDAFSQYKFLDPKIFGERWKAGRFGGPDGFLERYVETYGFGGHKPKTFKNLDELHEKISSVAFQMTREEAGGFPLEQYQTIHFPLTNPALKHYVEMENHLKTLVLSTTGEERVVAEIILTQVLRLQQITGGFLPVLDPEDRLENVPLGTDRIKALRELVSEYPLDEPLVIFCRFRFEMVSILKLMEDMGRTHSFIAGGMSPSDRDQSKRGFQSGITNTSVVQIRAGGIAIDLSRANTGIFYSTTTSFIDYEQAKARIISRRGGSVSLVHLVAQGTIDEMMVESLQTKQELVSLILRGHKNEG